MEAILKETIARFFQVDLNRIDAEFPLSGKRLQGSLARAQLDAAIRHHVGVKCPAVYSAKTYGELEQAVLGNSSIQTVRSDSVTANSKSPLGVSFSKDNGGEHKVLGCGIDIEMVENFPEVKDYWNDPFYSASFTPIETAYCLLQENPRIHFAARWCVKEALKKCQQGFLNEEFNNLELVSTEAGPPALRHYQNGVPTILPFAVSISHTPMFAIGVVIKRAMLE